MSKRPLKLCFCASSGGHYWNMLQLKNLADKYDSFCITEKQKFQENPLCKKIYFVPMINRKDLLFIFKFICITIKSLAIFLKQRPNIVVSDGALATYPVMLIARLFRCKIIFFETTARVNTPSFVGKLAYKFADLFIVQYESMLKIYPKAKIGVII